MGARRLALARLVVPSVQLLRLHAAVAAAMAEAPGVPERVHPGRWTPHLTLARGLDANQVGVALAVLGEPRSIDGSVVSVRRWDPGAGLARRLDGVPTMGA